MRSVGIDLKCHLDGGMLRFEAARPSLYGLEMHLARMNRDIEQFAPAVLVVDTISAFRGPSTEIHATLVRLVDICKTKGITALFTSLSGAGEQMMRASEAYRRSQTPGFHFETSKPMVSAIVCSTFSSRGA